MQLQPLVGDSYARLADTLERREPAAWDSPSLCAGWRVREVIAHVTTPARLTVEQFGAELAAVNGDFQLLSDTIATRDSGLPIAEQQLANLRSPSLAGWQPPGGGEIGALNHAVVHGLDVTNALQLPAPAPRPPLGSSWTASPTAASQRASASTRWVAVEATDLDWSWGSGRAVSASAAELISLVCHRTLPRGRTLS